jgi:hypothetical protein
MEENKKQKLFEEILETEKAMEGQLVIECSEHAEIEGTPQRPALKRRKPEEEYGEAKWNVDLQTSAELRDESRKLGTQAR